MSLWNYIGEFFFFRWLFGSRKRSDILYNETASSRHSFNEDDISEPDLNFEKRYSHDYSHFDNHDYDYSQSYDDFLDEQDDYDMMDDDF